MNIWEKQRRRLRLHIINKFRVIRCETERRGPRNAVLKNPGTNAILKKVLKNRNGEVCYEED